MAPSKRESVPGIGGFFFRAHDPTGLANWYQQHLGVSLTPASYKDSVWRQGASPTVFSPFPQTTGYFRVRNLDRMAAQLAAAGIAVKTDPQLYPNGWFARLHDPEGNPIELWEPKEPE